VRSFPIVVALVVATTLTACSSPYHEQFRDGGIEPSVAEAQLLAVPEITTAHFQTVEWYSPGEGGLADGSGMNIFLSVTVDPQYSIADDSQFVEFLAATAWSVNDHYPKGQVVLAVTGGRDPSHDWEPAVLDVFGDDAHLWNGVLYLDEEEFFDEGASLISLSVGEYADEFGRWPSEPVESPSDLFVIVPPVVPAITDATWTEFLNEAGEECVRVDFVRGATFVGPVTVTILDANGAELRTQDTNTSELTSCFFAGKRPVGGSAFVTAQVEPGYSAVELTVTPESGN
jgi:hypothetical protein